MMRFGVIDQVVTEPPGGAHRDPAAAIVAAGEAIGHALDGLAEFDREAIRRHRREKFLAIGRTMGEAGAGGCPPESPGNGREALVSQDRCEANF
jgi:hypothetical protein